MDSIFKNLTETPMLENVEITDEGDIHIPTGLVYSNQTSLDFDLIQRNEATILTDNGRTLAYLDEIFELTEPDVIKNIRAATEHYKVGMKKQRMALAIESEEAFTEGYLRMLFCANFTDAMKIFYV